MNYYRRYVGNYLKKTARLSLLEHGAYSLMLDYYYAEEKPLPAEPREVYRLVRALDRDEQLAIDRVLEQFFVLMDDGYHNERADQELGIATVVIATARENGKLGGRPKTKNITSDETQNITQIETGGETGTVTRDEPRNNHPPTTNHLTASPQPSTVTPQPRSRAKRAARSTAPGFDDFWARYPKKVGKQEAERQWNLLAPDDDLRVTIIAALEEQKQSRQWSDTNFIKDPERWIKKRRWEDQVPRETDRDPVAAANQRAADAFVMQGGRVVGSA